MNKTQNPNIGHRIVHLLILLFHSISMIIPLRIWLFLGKCFGYFWYLIDWHHRKIALINLKFAYGDEKDDKELKAIASSYFMKQVITGFEWIRLVGLTKSRLDNIKSRIQVEGEEHLTAAKKKNPSVILLSAHFGNWEYAHLFFADTFNRLNFIVRAIDNPLLEKKRVAYNERFGVNILYKDNGLRPAIKNLKKGEDLVIFPDRKAKLSEGIPCLFFNQKTSTISIIYTLATKYNIPIVPMFIFRTKDITRHKIVFFPELNIEGMDITEATNRQNDIIEKAIRELPEQWLWIHRKWKCYHEEIYK
ncbi:MAG: lysophospholipid acyltransferase family protein [Desulfobacteraceae bacterium]|jgi:KDO2-lipid IV(A) lauroyltransferase